MRRLSSILVPSETPETMHLASALNFSRLGVDWPYGAYFDVASLACLPGTAGLLVRSPLVTYRATGLEGIGSARENKEMLQLRPALPRAAFPAGAVALCTKVLDTLQGEVQVLGSASCLWGALEDDSLALWPYGQSRQRSESGVVLRIHSGSRPWRHFTGAIVRCSDAALLLQGESAQQGDDWCLLLAGWDGVSVPLVALHLPGGPSQPPAADAMVVSYVDAPLPRLRDALVSTLHLDAESGQLWALLAGGELQVWDLTRLRSIGFSRPQLGIAMRSTTGAAPQLRAVAMTVCQESQGSRLLLAAHESADVAPELFWALLPFDLSSTLAPVVSGNITL